MRVEVVLGLSRKRTQLLAYLAGVFDGEGTVGAYRIREGGDYSLKVAVAMTEPAAIALLLNEFPTGKLSVRQKKTYPNAKPQVVVTFNGLQSYDFLTAIKPYVIIKWEQVKLALSFQVHKRRTFDQWHNPCAYCARTAARLQALKIPDLNAVKTVELLRRHGLRQYRAKREDVEQDCASILKNFRERVETRLSPSMDNKAISAAEQDIVPAALLGGQHRSDSLQA